MAANVLKLEDVTMRFGGVVAVDSLNLEVNEGEIVALIGPNGAGKTTAFNCITGVYEPTGGTVLLDGGVSPQTNRAPICIAGGEASPPASEARGGIRSAPPVRGKKVSLTPDRITKLGIARTFQNIRLFSSLTVFENVLIAKHMRAKQNVFSATLKLNYKEERRMRAETMELLETQGLAQYSDDIAGSLPYGLQRRLEIARALATKPKLLLLDEPAAGMNPQETLELTELIVKIKDDYKLTVFMIEHHMDLVMKISERIYVLDFGKLIASGSPDEVRGDERVIEAYLGVQGDA